MDGMATPEVEARPLRWWRAQRVLSVRELAERAGVSTRVITDLEGGRVRRPHPATMRKLAEALATPPSSIAEFSAVMEAMARRPPARDDD